MKKKVIAFDIDDTLVVTKSPLDRRMSALLERLLQSYEVCIISGGKFEIFKQNIVDCLTDNPDLLSRLHLMPTCGTRYYRYDRASSMWSLQYAHDLSDDQKSKIVKVLEDVAKEMGIWCENPRGEVIEDRLSQITHSALGQEAAAEDKYRWAKENEELRKEFRDAVAKLLPEVEVRIGGTTSTDITLPGVDKSYGINKLIDTLQITKDNVLYVGDKLEEGGNDYPVKDMGVDCIAVNRWQDTAYVVEGILGVS